MRGAILVLSGPSGAGKSTVIQAASEYIGEYYFSISTTTRAPRAGEVDGRDYFFVTKEAFEEDIKAGNFLEYAQVHGNYYGTSLGPVMEALDAHKLVIFDIDVQGHRLVRAKLGDITTSVFMVPPSLSELDRRLRLRSSDAQEAVTKRIENAKGEMEALDEYDFAILNDDIALATSEFVTIVNAARLKRSKRDIEEFVSKWLQS